MASSTDHSAGSEGKAWLVCGCLTLGEIASWPGVVEVAVCNSGCGAVGVVMDNGVAGIE